jgi:hypothetical protein
MKNSSFVVLHRIGFITDQCRRKFLVSKTFGRSLPCEITAAAAKPLMECMEKFVYGPNVNQYNVDHYCQKLELPYNFRS